MSRMRMARRMKSRIASKPIKGSEEGIASILSVVSTNQPLSRAVLGWVADWVVVEIAESGADSGADREDDDEMDKPAVGTKPGTTRSQDRPSLSQRAQGAPELIL
jgi:hypothetical protein